METTLHVDPQILGAIEAAVRERGVVSVAEVCQKTGYARKVVLAAVKRIAGVACDGVDLTVVAREAPLAERLSQEQNERETRPDDGDYVFVDEDDPGEDDED